MNAKLQNMRAPSLSQLYAAHEGKVSDKWSLYIDEYDRIFSKYRKKPIRILEIGVQNGGSLELWGKYFPKAEIILGCDINQNCGLLRFDDDRIEVVVGDANTEEVERSIMARAKNFDIIVDDGSHKSRDIIHNFARYFPHVAEGGAYVVEDLHCSYWREYQGGLYDPLSSISFFKRLVDVGNSEHWGLNLSRKNALAPFAEGGQAAFDDASLATIHSVEFLNSLCIVTKRPVHANILGRRWVKGRATPVDGSSVALDGMTNQAVDQTAMPNSPPLETLEEEIAVSRALIKSYEERVKALSKDNNEFEARLLAARRAVSERDTEIETLVGEKKALDVQTTLLLADRDAARSEEQRLHNVLDAVYASSSWRLTRPLRGARRSAAALISGGRILRKKGSSDGTEHRVKARGMSGRPSRVGVNAPSFEALSGYSDEGSLGLTEVEKDNSKLIAFYLPQFHRIPENSEWWGPGFTEWNNVSRAKPNFDGHVQPNIPRELGYYDLKNIDVMIEQIELAKLYGVGGFCFYHYWFSGRRILESPVENFLKSEIDFRFCLCWANENWTRTWDGDTKSVLLAQEYAQGDAEAFFDSVVDAFCDERYIKISGRPLLLVYRAKALPNPNEWFEIWRRRAEQRGFPGLHIAVVDFYDISNPNDVGADSLVEFPPHKFNGPQSRPDLLPRITNPDFAGGVVDYRKVISQSALRETPQFKLFRGIMPSWDNTPRRQNTPTIVVNSSPYLYGAWLRYLRAYVRAESPDEDGRLIFINAWNEWGEGCYLEPDQKQGLSYLEETLKASFHVKRANGESGIDGARSQLFEALKHAQLSATVGGESSRGSNLSAQAEVELTSYRAPSAFAHKVSFALRKWPKIQKLARLAYIAAVGLRR